MANSFEVKIEGVEELSARIKGLDEEVRYKGGRFAARRAAQVIARAAAKNWSQTDDPATGRSIAENIVQGSKYPGVRFSSRRFKRTGDIMFRVGVSGGAKTSRNPDESAGAPTPHWRLLEFGTESIAPRGYMRKAATQSAQDAVNVFATELTKKLNRLTKA